MAEHFVQPPHWEWYILGYFFFAGLTGGSYALATMLRFWGGSRDEAAARVGFLIAFPALIVCPLLLSLDLGQPLRFWHMLVNTTPGQGGPVYKYWSPMSVGSWILLVYGVFAFVSFLEVLGRDGRLRVGALTHLLVGGFGRAFTAVGAILGLFVASYTGVLLSVSNQPVWSDTWTLGGLFLASGLSGSAALLSTVGRYRREAAYSEGRLRRADGYFALLELILIVAFFVTLAPAGTLSRVLAAPWIVLWVLVAIGLIPPLSALVGRESAGRAPAASSLAALVVLIGVLALRAIVIFSAQI